MTRLSRDKQPLSLNDWLDAATRGLCPETQTRIREEVEAHYMETLRAEFAKDEGDLEALLNAGRSLGDARVARRQFRRRHLTKNEALIVDCFSESPPRFPRSPTSRKKLCLGQLGGVFTLALMFSFTVPTVAQVTAIAVFMSLFLMTTIALWNPPQQLNVAEKFQWRACVEAVQANFHAASLLVIGKLALFSHHDDLTMAEQLYSDYGSRLWLGLLAAWCVMSARANLKIAGKLRGQYQTPEAT